MLKKALRHYLEDRFAALTLIVIGTIAWSVTIVKSGLFYPFGIGFWGPNGHDGVWHIAVSEVLSRGSFEMPVFAEEAIKNYHLGFDALLAFLHRLTLIPIHSLYFQIIPPLLAFLIGVFTYKFVLGWKKSKTQAFWATFFIYFGGNFGWIITLLREGGFGGESMFWSQQAISTLINPPFALSIVLMLAGLMVLKKYLTTPNNKYLLLTILIFGVVLQIKVYAGLLSLAGLFIATAWMILVKGGLPLSISTLLHRAVENKRLLLVFLGSLTISLLLFFPFNSGASKLLVPQPFWFLETMMGFADRLYWPKFFNAMTAYKNSGNLLKGIPAYLVAFGIFWVGNLGTRVIKEVLVLKWLRNIKKLTFNEVFFATVIGAGIIIPMFFIQKGTPWNTIQFVYYSLTFSGILAGVWLGDWLEAQNATVLRSTVAAVVVLLTVPTTLGTLRHYLPARPPAKLSFQELGALKFLAKQPKGTVLTYPFDKDRADAAVANPPRPLYLYESTAYVSAFSGQPVYLEDEVNLDITGYDWRFRRTKVLEFLGASSEDAARNFLQENDISYIYLTRDREKLDDSRLGITKIFENKEVEIFRVN